MSIRENIAKRIAPTLKNKNEIKEIVLDEIKRAKMALPITANYDPNNEGYRRMSDGIMQIRDLSAITQDRMFEIAYFMFDNSAMVKGLASLDKGFLFAEPMKINCDDPDVQDVVDEFWEKNNLEIDFPDMMMWLSILGEQCWPVDMNKYNGFVELAYMDPSLIKEVWVNKINPRELILLELQDIARKPAEKLRIINKNMDFYSREFGRLSGECFFFSINHPLNSPRGRSDYLTLFDWIDGLERYGFNYLERADFLLNFVWDVLLRGYDEGQIRKWLSQNPPPEPGSIRAHNENVEWKAIAPDIKGHDFKESFDTGKEFVMGSLRRPESWFGGGGKAYQTESEQFGQVPIKDLSQRQILIKKIAKKIIQFAIDQAFIAGRLTQKQAESQFAIDMPKISQKDLQKMLNSFPQLTTALTVAEQQKWISKETATRLFAFIGSQFGMEIDIQKKPKKITKGISNRQKNNLDQPFDTVYSNLSKKLNMFKFLSNGSNR